MPIPLLRPFCPYLGPSSVVSLVVDCTVLRTLTLNLGTIFSWTGNLVTNRNWEHFWLNEGFTTFLERKIKGKMMGEEHRQFSAIEGLESLTDE
ncbi:hypothetical protein BV898_20126, partial [Hypsibius exemplaris]